MKVDYLIVGQGIAGSLLAWFLLKKGKTVLVIDDNDPGSASKVAAGIINPVTGKRLVKSWKIDELLPFAEQTYRELEQQLNIDIFKPYEIIKLFSNEEDAAFYHEKKSDPELSAYVDPLKAEQYEHLFRDISLGGVVIKRACRIDFHSLLNGLRNWLSEKDLLRAEAFDYRQIVFSGDEVAYGDITARKLIFCEGSRALQNPYFNRLPFNPAKGEILTVRIKGFPEEKIWTKGMFILPAGPEIFKTGTTYNWNFEDHQPTEAAKEDITARLKKAISLPFEILDHQAAIRPTVNDRRPFLGLHPEYPQLAIFNGLGTKGASLAPFFAGQMCEMLLNGKPLDPEADIIRFGR